jgi:prepilin-type N-terminal cleavage/methylation domain-containing protein/prepilin-type processing-associated H-X9-DG protein
MKIEAFLENIGSLASNGTPSEKLRSGSVLPLERRHLPLRVAAFTLIELLVVLGIIALLASLSIPGSIAAKRKANNVHCRSNLRQIGIAIRVYADDYEARLPRVIPEAEPPGQAKGVSITGLLARYVSSSNAVFKCREDRQGWFERTGTSYDWNTALNGRLIDRPSGGSGAQPASSSDAMMHDHESWHGHKNAVFVDGHVERLR